MIACLEQLVGITDNPCPCYDNTDGVISYNPDEIKTSESGYYLTDHDYGVPMLPAVLASRNCGDGSIWEAMVRARTSAINSIETDLRAALLLRFDKGFKPFDGAVGQAKFSGTQAITADYAGIQIRPDRYKDASLVITGVWMALTTSEVKTLTFGSNNPEFTSTTRDVTSGAQELQKTVFVTPVTLPMYSILEDDLRYTVTYEIDGNQPVNNSLSCCGDTPDWKNVMRAEGVVTSDLSRLNDYDYGSSNAHGLILEAYITCDFLAWVCELRELNGYDFRDVLARTIQFRAGVGLLTFILESSQSNFYTHLETEALYGKRNHYSKRYEENIMWMVRNLPERASGCYKCKPGPISLGSL